MRDMALLEEFTAQLLRGCKIYDHRRLLPLADYMFKVVREPELGIEPGPAGLPNATRMQDWNASYAL